MKHELTPQRKERRIMAVWTSLVLTTALFTTSAFAADSDPLTIVNNLSDFIFSCIKAIGIIILGWGVVQLVCLCSRTTRRRERRASSVCSVVC